MSIVSQADHWLFIGSNGGICAGRKNAENALFPYYTDDKIIESAENTGSKTSIRITKNNKTFVWEPFSFHYSYQYTLKRNLYKNIIGNKIIFEEVNKELGLTFQYQWSTSDRFGFIKTSKLINNTKQHINVSLLDGIQNIMPYGVGSMLQNSRSNLVDAYKRNELHASSGVATYALSSIIVDKAEPSEALKATTVWSAGLERINTLLSGLQLHAFRNGKTLQTETDVKAERGAYFIHADITLQPSHVKEWIIVADVNQSISNIIALQKQVESNSGIKQEIDVDIKTGSEQLLALCASADGLQKTADLLRDTRHFANTMFNIMRGGIFDNHYQLDRADLLVYFSNANPIVFKRHKSLIEALSEICTHHELNSLAEKTNDADFIRLALEYLPLKFSRRHGDPSRPWNQFSINIRNEDGKKVLDYEGNWRDIFQNWEALAHAYPDFMDGMITKFLNASTFDGYNPYRITKSGIDWEKIEADDPWSYIGYWGDHQIIYLLKFLEFAENHQPGKLEKYFSEEIFVYANVPYKIKSYHEILKNPKDTINFDHALDHAITKRKEIIGADSALLQNQNNEIHHVNFLEKILATLLAKLSNFIPEGGIWMNTQRPEWNDANNALVGNGVSVVTLCYVRRFLSFFIHNLTNAQTKEINLSKEMIAFYRNMKKAFEQNENLLNDKFTDLYRKKLVDALGIAASEYREKIYNQSFKGEKETIYIKELRDFLALVLRFTDHSIKANERNDKLYHAYNLLTIENNESMSMSISYLPEMLEGQVAVLSSGYLNAKQQVETLHALRKSNLYRHDQNSYLLYPNKELKGFLDKNNISKETVNQSPFLRLLIEKSNNLIIEKDIHGNFHFNGGFKNANDLLSALQKLPIPVTEENTIEILNTFESIFNHKAFTGRSGTFYGYEGLGSIYWHMVSKLALAVQECCAHAIDKKEEENIVDALVQHFREINEGIGVHKSPSVYGAFPTDPYSHTPANKGAQQPGMTGQVKEDIIARIGELGVTVKDGYISFNPFMLSKNEFIKDKSEFSFIDVKGKLNRIQLPEKSLCFTYCQIPVIYSLSNNEGVTLTFNNDTTQTNTTLKVDIETSNKIWNRNGNIKKIEVNIKADTIR
ncbi:MAG: hypothetical protein O9340_11810 [Cyclobacteriaceae bacterium]|nr:hypothetical protein [Cyclobacteriaceae bacterium]